MRIKEKILLVDSAINFILGFLLIAYSPRLVAFLGVPITESGFYPNILGGVFFGIALALLLEVYGKDSKYTAGLGLIGAIGINLCGGIVLLFWLLSGNLHLPVRGMAFLWSLDIILLVISSLELFNHFKAKG